MSITSERKFVADLAKATISIFDGGRSTASAAHIARAHFGDRSYNLNVVYDVQNHLRRIKALLDTDYQLPVVLVQKDAYNIIKAGGPKTRADAMKCLPSGKGRISDGIHLCNSIDDLIYEMSIEMNLRRAAGKERRNMDRLLSTHGRGHIDGSTIADIADDIAARRKVATPGTLAQIIAARQHKELEDLVRDN